MTGTAADRAVRAAVDDAARTSYGRLLAVLTAGSRDLAAAEDALAEAFLAAVRTWPDRGVPDHPEAWLLTAARRALVDAARRRDVAARALPALARLATVDAVDTPEPDPSVIPDARLELLFTCAHPAVAVGVRSPLMLQAVLGLDAARIASAFLVSPSSMAQRLVRAKTKIREAGIPFAVPGPRELPDRLGSVLDAVYAAYGTGWDDFTGRDVRRRGITDEAVRLAGIVADLLPEQAEAHGLLATLLHVEARHGARRGPDGAFVPLDEQDPRHWAPTAMADAERHLARAYALEPHAPGPYQLQAAIQSMHNRRSVTGRTDWAAVSVLHDQLALRAPSTGALVARAAARLHAGDVTGALRLLDELDPTPTRGYQPYWVVRAHCLQRLADERGARKAAAVALGLTEDPAVRTYLHAAFGRWPAPARPTGDPGPSDGPGGVGRPGPGR